MSETHEHKGILIVSFGTSVEDTRQRTIDPLERDIAAAFADRLAYTAWDSTRIVEKVRDLRGEVHDTVDEALARIAADGIRDLIVQPTFLINGVEMRKLKDKLAAWKPADITVRLGMPLLVDANDRNSLVRIYAEEFAQLESDEMLVIMGHGSLRDGNDVYFQMNDEFKALGLGNFIVVTLKDELPFAVALDAVEDRKPRHVHIVPLMMVAGRHAAIDMEGPGPTSWKSQLESRGYAVTCHPRGLGECAGVREMLVRHAREATIFEEEKEMLKGKQ